MYDTDDRRSNWQEMPHEQPQLIEYDWAHERKQEKKVPIAIIEAVLAELGDDDEEPPVH